MSDISTEIKIKEAAREVFIQKGMTGARMQEIADKAGINKALLHYYYRNKEQLFNAVFEETLQKFIPQLFAVLNSELPLEVKVYQVSDKYISFLSEHPEVPMFILGEVQRDPGRLVKKMEVGRNRFTVLEAQLSREAEKGNIKPISVEMFTMNMISLLVFQFIGGPLFKNAMGMDDDQFEAFLEARKKEVPKFIMNALKP